jgi:hypothetical protein
VLDGALTPPRSPAGHATSPRRQGCRQATRERHGSESYSRRTDRFEAVKALHAVGTCERRMAREVRFALSQERLGGCLDRPHAAMEQCRVRVTHQSPKGHQAANVRQGQFRPAAGDPTRGSLGAWCSRSSPRVNLRLGPTISSELSPLEPPSSPTATLAERDDRR